MSSELIKKQEDVVSRFASLLGSASKASKPKENISSFFSKTIDDDVVCTLPSLDMTWGEEEGSSDNPLPKVGEHSKSSDSQGDNLPVMEASVLGDSDTASTTARTEQKSTQRLGKITSWTKSTMPYCSEAIAKNVSNSFSSLVDSRVRSWTLLMFKHSLSSGDDASRSRLLSMLSASINVTSAESSFKTLPLPESAAGHHKEADVILPLLFEVVLRICLQDREDSVTLRAPGTISGHFAPKDPEGLQKVEIRLDSGALLSSMVDQARLSVFKTVAKVTATDLEPQGMAKSSMPKAPKPSIPRIPSIPKTPSTASLNAANTEPSQEVPTTLSSRDVPSFSNAVQLPSEVTAQSPRLEKARSSALRLNSVLHGKLSATEAGVIRKQRSVQWDHPFELPALKNSMPSAKRLRVVQTATRLKSIESFGRPHAGDFGSGARNATFGDFGRKPVWGRNGKMSNHPQPSSGLERSRQDLLGVQLESSSRNASFTSFSKPSALLSRGKVGVTTSIPDSIPRTATALESWLMNSTSRK